MQQPNTANGKEVLLAHVNKLRKAGKTVIIPTGLAIEQARSAELPLAACPVFLAAKDPMGRLITDYSPFTGNGVNGSSPRSDARWREAAEATYGTASYATTVAVCQSIHDCATTCGGLEHVHAQVDDASNAYRRVPLLRDSVLLGAFTIFIRSVAHICLLVRPLR